MCVLQLIYVSKIHTYITLHVYIRINIHPYMYIHTYMYMHAVHVCMYTHSAIFTQITRIIIYFDHFRFSKDKLVSMQMKPCIPSKEWYICFSSKKKTQYATDEKLRGCGIHPPLPSTSGILGITFERREIPPWYLPQNMRK